LIQYRLWQTASHPPSQPPSQPRRCSYYTLNAKASSLKTPNLANWAYLCISRTCKHHHDVIVTWAEFQIDWQFAAELDDQSAVQSAERVCQTVAQNEHYVRQFVQLSVQQLLHGVNAMTDCWTNCYIILCNCCTDSLSNSRIAWTAYNNGSIFLHKVKVLYNTV